MSFDSAEYSELAIFGFCVVRLTAHNDAPAKHTLYEGLVALENYISK